MLPCSFAAFSIEQYLKRKYQHDVTVFIGHLETHAVDMLTIGDHVGNQPSRGGKCFVFDGANIRQVDAPRILVEIVAIADVEKVSRHATKMDHEDDCSCRGVK